MKRNSQGKINYKLLARIRAQRFADSQALAVQLQKSKQLKYGGIR